jgi:hypothetical protein
MKWLIAVLAFVGAVAVGFYGMRSRKSASSTWTHAKDSASSWGKTATEKAGAATNNVAHAAESAASTASDAVDGLEGAVGSS